LTAPTKAAPTKAGLTGAGPTRRQADAATTIAWAAARVGVDLPVRVRAWDSSEAGPPGPPTVVLRSPLALRRALWRPGELGLARAYVSGDLDVEGDLTEGLRLAWGAIRSARSGRAAVGGSGCSAPRPPHPRASSGTPAARTAGPGTGP
jgi:cyclopropane-fatty-acyl-phospholipid synthase